MLRITVLSLLLGALALIAGLSLFFSPGTTTDSLAPPVQLNAGASKVDVGAGAPGNGDLQLKLSNIGVGVVRLTDTRIAGQAYPYLHLAIPDAQGRLQRPVDAEAQPLHELVG